MAAFHLARSWQGLPALLAAAGLALALAVPAAQAQQTHLRIASNQIGGSQSLQVLVNKSMILDLPIEAAEVIVSQPAIAAVVMRSKTRAIVQGVSGGETNVFFLDALGRTISVLDLQVVQQQSDVAAALRGALQRLLPDTALSVESVTLNGVNRIVLSGTAGSTEDVDKAVAIASQFAGGPENVSNVITLPGSQQVMLKVTVAEVSRDAVKQLGVNLNATADIYGLQTGIVSSPSLGGASNVVSPSSLRAGFDVGPVSVDATIRALERRGAIRTLAEPVLTAMSGQPAEFLAGGEFPIPNAVTTDDQGNSQIAFEYRQFGVNLKFTPVVKSSGVIGLNVDTSVSEPTTEGGFNANGVIIPGIQNREARTVVQMRSGQTLAIAGMFREQVRQQFNTMPGIGQVPILGALFRSRDFVRSQTELLVLVTPYLATPVDGTVPLPTDAVDFAGDAEATFLGHMEKLYGVEGNQGAGGYQGAVGFILD